VLAPVLSCCEQAKRSMSALVRYGVTVSTCAIHGFVVVVGFVVFRGQCQQQSGQFLATIDQPDIRGPKPHNQECIPLLTEVVENSSQYNDCSPADLRSPSTLANVDGAHDHLGSLLAAFVISEY
jgi:hypothetical protein